MTPVGCGLAASQRLRYVKPSLVLFEDAANIFFDLWDYILRPQS
jgi:hypothetical protein